LLIVKIDKAVNCPYCQSVKVVRNGVKKNGMQNLLCRQCNKQFQPEYLYWACDPDRRVLITKMLLRGSGIRDCAAVTGVSKESVLRLIIRNALQVELKPKYSRYTKVQIDELWSYVGQQQKKVWMLYAYSAEDGEILGFAMGKRNSKTVSNLLLKLKALEIDFFLTDNWKAFKVVLPYEKHLIGKQFTKAIEGVNTWFRTRLRRLVRRTVCFSKKLIYHYSIIKTAIYHRNHNSSYI
jgi:insertion element IS1 protein InsB